MKYPISAQRIKDAINRTHISAAELSRRSGVGKSAISHYINGRYCPHNDNAYKLAQVLGVNPSWLMGFNVPMIVSTEFDDKILIEINKELDKMDSENRSNILNYLKFINQMKEGE